MAEILSRGLLERLFEAVSQAPVTLIVGPRQCGKSTLCKSLRLAQPSWREITLDDPIALSLAINSPQEFLRTYPTPLIIDEIQRAPGLLLAMKLVVDKNRVPGSYVLTGSANVLTLPKVSESLAGRMEVLDLHPLTQRELNQSKGKSLVDFLFEGEIQPSSAVEESQLEHRVARGGFPEPALRSTSGSRRSWFQSYLRSILDRDARDVAQIENVEALHRLLKLLATRSGQTLNTLSLSRDTGIPESTMRRYVDLLNRLFLIQMVPPWMSAADSRVLKSPKAYLSDSGLACHLQGYQERTFLNDRDKLVAPLEGFVANELNRMLSISDEGIRLFHLRTVRLKEVDFVLEHPDGTVVGIDLLQSKTVKPEDSEGLRYQKELSEDRFKVGILLYDGMETIPLGTQLWAMPYSALWEVG